MQHQLCSNILESSVPPQWHDRTTAGSETESCHSCYGRPLHGLARCKVLSAMIGTAVNVGSLLIRAGRPILGRALGSASPAAGHLWARSLACQSCVGAAASLPELRVRPWSSRKPRKGKVCSITEVTGPSILSDWDSVISASDEKDPFENGVHGRHS